jgi:hypothetical protein
VKEVECSTCRLAVGFLSQLIRDRKGNHADNVIFQSLRFVLNQLCLGANHMHTPMRDLEENKEEHKEEHNVKKREEIRSDGHE